MPRHAWHLKALALAVLLGATAHLPCAAQTPADSATWEQLTLSRLLQKVGAPVRYRMVTIETADSSASRHWSEALAEQLRSALLASSPGADTLASLEVTLLPLRPLARGDRPGAQWDIVMSRCDAIPPHGSGGESSTFYTAETIHADSTWRLYLSSTGHGDGLCAYPPATR